jgi:hypothetical protein
MAAKLIKLTHQIEIQLHLVAESCTLRSFSLQRPVRKLLDTPFLYSNVFSRRTVFQCVRLRPEQLSIIDFTQCYLNFIYLISVDQTKDDMGGHVAYMGEMRYVHNILVEKPVR